MHDKKYLINHVTINCVKIIVRCKLEFVHRIPGQNYGRLSSNFTLYSECHQLSEDPWKYSRHSSNFKG